LHVTGGAGAPVVVELADASPDLLRELFSTFVAVLMSAEAGAM
jgi:hypothetical protein